MTTDSGWVEGPPAWETPRPMNRRGRAGLVVLVGIGTAAWLMLAPVRPGAAQTSTTAAPAAVAGTSGGDQVDPEAHQRLNRIVLALAGLGVVAVGAGVWYLLATRPTPVVLEGLDTMTKRRWRRAAPPDRLTMLERIRDARGGQVADRIVEPSSLPRPSVGVPTAEPDAAASLDPVDLGETDWSSPVVHQTSEPTP